MTKKASDVFNETNYAFGSKDSFEKAFPEIEKMSICVTEMESLIWMKEQSSHYLTADSPGGEYIDCTNPSCCAGGFSMGEILRKAVRNKAEEIDEKAVCKGTETMGRRCMHAFTISGSIKYKA